MRNFFDISLRSFLSDEAEANNLKFHEELASDKKEEMFLITATWRVMKGSLSAIPECPKRRKITRWWKLS